MSEFSVRCFLLGCNKGKCSLTLLIVSNAGLSVNVPTYFAEVDEQEHDDIVSVNVKALLRVTHAVLPGMIHI